MIAKAEKQKARNRKNFMDSPLVNLFMQGNIIIVNKKPQMKAMQYLANCRPNIYRLKFFSQIDKWEIVLYEKVTVKESIRWAIFWKVSFYYKGE